MSCKTASQICIIERQAIYAAEKIVYEFEGLNPKSKMNNAAREGIKSILTELLIHNSNAVFFANEILLKGLYPNYDRDALKIVRKEIKACKN